MTQAHFKQSQASLRNAPSQAARPYGTSARPRTSPRSLRCSFAPCRLHAKQPVPGFGGASKRPLPCVLASNPYVTPEDTAEPQSAWHTSAFKGQVDELWVFIIGPNFEPLMSTSKKKYVVVRNTVLPQAQPNGFLTSLGSSFE